jgi:hypothetical protein
MSYTFNPAKAFLATKHTFSAEHVMGLAMGREEAEASTVSREHRCLSSVRTGWVLIVNRIADRDECVDMRFIEIPRETSFQ